MSEKLADGQYAPQPPLANPQHPQPVQPPPYPGQPQPVPIDQYYPAAPRPMYPPQPQQQQSSNVVVVSSQPAPMPVIIAHHSHAPDYLTLTIVGFVLCFFCGGVVGMLLLIPALICSVMAQDANSNGDYENARSLGRASLIWNIFVYIFGALAVVGVIVAAVVVVQNRYTYCFYDRYPYC